MVYFALTKHGLAAVLQLPHIRGVTFWVNHELLDAAGLKRLREDGFDLTNFTRWIDPSDAFEVEVAVQTIREHHPDQVLYVEQPRK